MDEVPRDRAAAGSVAGAGGALDKGRRTLLIVLVALASAYGLFARWREMQAPAGFMEGVCALPGLNCLKYGYADFGLAKIVSPGPVVERPQRIQYQTRPPGVPWVSSLGIAVFGHHTWSVRLPHLLCGVGLVVLLAWFTSRMYGPVAGAWCAIFGAVLPGVVRYAGPYVDHMGPVLLFWIGLAAFLYYRYCETGRRVYFWLLLVAGILGLMTDWAAYSYCFVLFGHAVLYRSRASWRPMLVLPLVALACFAVFVLYALSIPPERHLFGSLGDVVRGAATGDEGDYAVSYSAAGWVLDFAMKFVKQFSPLAVLGLVWMLARVPRSIVPRVNRPDQHTLMLWVYALPEMVLIHRHYYLHDYCNLVLVHATVISLGALIGSYYGRPGARGRTLRAWVGAACCLFAMQWSWYVLTMEKRPDRAEHGRLCVLWAEDLARHTAFDEESGLAVHYAQQMRFVADRRVRGDVDSAEQLAALQGEGKLKQLFVPAAYPCGDPAFGGALIAKCSFEMGDATLRFSLPRPPRPGEPAVRRLAGVALGGDLTVRELSYALVQGADGSRLLFLGPTLNRAPSVGKEDAMRWRVRFVGEGDLEVALASAQARQSASYFFKVPKAWSPETGRVEVVLRHDSADAASVGALKRYTRTALRFLSFRAFGNPEPRVREFPGAGEPPLVLSRF